MTGVPTPLVGYRRLLMIGPRSHQRARARPRRILIVEDELVIALMMEEIVREMGCAVSGIAGTLGMARLQFAKRDFDAVLLDVNLDGEYNPETADLLLEMGVPFAFVTGYDYVVDPRGQSRMTSLRFALTIRPSKCPLSGVERT